jgi:hypothetical protein
MLAWIPGTRWLFVPLAAYLCARGAIWHLKPPGRFRLDRYPRQAARSLAGQGWAGTAYFGWILGVSVYTQMATPLVQALAAVTAVLGPQFGLAAGVGLGLARSAAPWRGAIARPGSPPSLVVDRYVHRIFRSSFRIGGLTAATALLVAEVAVVAR